MLIDPAISTLADLIEQKNNAIINRTHSVIVKLFDSQVLLTLKQSGDCVTSFYFPISRHLEALPACRLRNGVLLRG